MSRTPPSPNGAAAPRELLRGLFAAALEAVDPMRVVPPNLPPRPEGRTVAIAVGKAAASMAQAVEAGWDGPLSGLAVTRYGHGAPCDRIEVIEAGHPAPDEAGLAAARRARAALRGLTPRDLALFLISGGGSALLVDPPPGLGLADKQAVNRDLLRCGASISEINCVRKHLSAVKGGRLAMAAAPARVSTLVISDAPGDDPGVVASGPSIADPTTLAEARAVLDRYGVAPPPAVAAHLADARNETPKSAIATDVRLVARSRDALCGAARAARRAGLAPLVLGDDLEGEARRLARAHAALARGMTKGILLSGGETTVTIGPGASGRGGRNAEYLLALALALGGDRRIHAIACDTDGIDGTEANAGAVIGPDTLGRAGAAGVDARAMLDGHDSYGFFDRLGDLVITGPTRTNVNDFRAILIGADGSGRGGP